MRDKPAVLITGASGLIGRRLCAVLLREGFDLRAMVRDRNGLGRLPVGVTDIVTGDLGLIRNWRPFLNGVDAIVHLAARAHQIKEDRRAMEKAYQRLNVGVTQALAAAAGAADVRRFVFISSVKAMGEATLPGEVWNESSPCIPQDPYGRSKLEAEQALWDINRNTKMDVVILRPPLVYGPGLKANMARLFKIVKSGLPLPFAMTHNSRSFVYLGNLVDAIRISLNHPAAGGETFLVSDGEDISTPELIRRIARALDRPARLLPFPPSVLRAVGRVTGQSAEVGRLVGSLVVDSGKIRRALSWKPPYTLEAGLMQTAEWFKSNEQTNRSRA